MIYTISDFLMGSSILSSSSFSAPSDRNEAAKREQEGVLEDRPAKESTLDADAPNREPVQKAAKAKAAGGSSPACFRPSLQERSP